MAWNEIPAKDDPNLSIQAYYARPNILHNLLKPISSEAFKKIWSTAEDYDLKQFRRSALVGHTVSDLIRALGLAEVTESEIGIGDWFTHSGTTFYSPRDANSDVAKIQLKGGATITAVVRHECRITSTASVNMSGADDASFVVGRLISSNKYDIVAAGYREPLFSTARHIDFTPVRDLYKLADGDPWASNFIRLKFDAPDVELLATTIEQTVEQFAAAVGRQGAWRLLYGRDGQPLHETQHQGIFRLFSKLPFGALGIHMDPNADHGSGPTDFTVRLNDSINIIEFKKDEKLSEIRHGLAIQLPNYMESAGAKRGTYIIMCHSRTKEEVWNLVRGVFDSDPNLPSIDCYVIDCTPVTSASKANSRYRSEG